ncbi:leucine-rich repeat and IQ domain-containing protein 3 isoform X1 [Loxodonta africana]|uniref:leucine-rich repeat and IQ domain-containing protein 3 isoform X1 n=1 Tax=Loxodonta africana TaxID=9785 RepID=UPI000223441E|nr:leucine-rich repeat and IQ domain-containing protein 3 isoform X1 [Loxodonta africana]
MFHGTITKELTIHEEWSHYNESMIEDQKDFVFVKFNGLLLKSMENLQSCISLRVCIFSNNFITDIQPLENCLKLIKLDLHGNQIKNLPGTKFWIGLKNLKLLYLHDNAFVKLKNISVLSACSNLIALTLFDCPVSLKKGYRHVLVNSIWSLKALDHHVVSDEEIIQNWHLPERFRTCNHRLFLNFCPALRKGTTYEDEINNIKHIISNINEILAHNSPVLIIQRWIRGFLVRKKLSHLFLCKKYQGKLTRSCDTKWIYIYKEYEDNLLKDLFFKPEPDIRETFTHWKYNIHSPVNFKSFREQRKYISSILSELKTKDTGIKSKKSRYLIQKGQKESEDEIEDEELDASFKITVSKLPICTSESWKDAAVLKERKQETFPTYVQPFSAIHQKPIIKSDTESERNVRKEFFITQRSGIKLQALCDIDKYYSEQKKYESHKKKLTAVTRAQVAKGIVRRTINETLSKKKCAAQQRDYKDTEMIQKGLHHRWQNRYDYIEKVRERRTQFLEVKKQKAADRLLIQELSNEHTLFTQGIIKADKLRKDAAVLREKHYIVQQKLNMEKYQKELLKQTKEIRAQEIHRKHCEEKFVCDMISFQKACERFQEAKTRAAVIKTNRVFKFPGEMIE